MQIMDCFPQVERFHLQSFELAKILPLCQDLHHLQTAEAFQTTNYLLFRINSEAQVRASNWMEGGSRSCTPKIAMKYGNFRSFPDDHFR
jgi:BarA-like signal transduction histidine kinase